MTVPEPLQGGLNRQRRFLTLISAALIAFYWLDVDVQNKAEYSGFAVTLGHPSRVALGLWLVWGWALWRYGQRVYEALSPIWAEILEDVRAEDLRVALAKAKRIGNKLAKKSHFDGMPTTARIRGGVKSVPPSSQDLDQVAGKQVTSYRDCYPTQDGGRKYMRLEATFDWVEGPNHGTVGEGFQMELSRFQTRWIRFRA